MSENKNIEDFLKDELNQEFEIQDGDLELLSDVLDDYNKEPNRKKGVFFIAAGVLFLVALIGSLFLLKNTSKNQENLIVVNCTLENKGEVFEKNNSNDASIKNKELCDSENEYTKTLKSTSSIIAVQSLNNSSFKKNNKPYSNKPNNKVVSEISQNNTKTDQSKKNESKALNEATMPLAVIEKVENKTIGNENRASKNSDVLKSEALLIENNILQGEKTITNNVSKSKNNDTGENKDIIVEKDLINENSDSDIVLDTLSEKKEILVLEKPLKKELGISIALNAGPSFLFRQFSSDNSKRKSEESNLIVWNASLDVYKTFKNSIIIGTGLGMVNYGEKIDYQAVEYTYKDTSYSYETNTYGLYSISKRNGLLTIDTTKIERQDTILTILDKTLIDNSVSKENGSTNFMYVEIPVKIGYKIIDTKKIDFSAMTGLSIGFLTESKGYYLNNDNILFKAKSKKVLFNYLLSADLKYNMYKNISLSLSPHFKYNLNNLSTIKDTKRTYSSFGINAGIVLDF